MGPPAILLFVAVNQGIDPSGYPVPVRVESDGTQSLSGELCTVQGLTYPSGWSVGRAGYDYSSTVARQLTAVRYYGTSGALLGHVELSYDTLNRLISQILTEGA
jgi:hypothetical protein